MDFENKISKKSNLEFNDSISTYNGWGSQQNYKSFEQFFNFIKKEKPSTIFEVGTSLGGFTMFLKYCCDILGIKTKVLTFDIYDRSEYKELRDSGIDVIVENIFENNYSSISQEYINVIQSEGTTIVLCDGGDKIREFNLLSKYIKKGDYILAHDYAFDEDDFNNRVNKQLWNWFEIQESDIKDACVENNLIDYDKHDFNNVVWVCKKKI